MRTRHIFHAVDSHTERMPTRVITGGVGVIPGATMAERRLHFIEHLDRLRTLLMYEPCGHAATSPDRPVHPTRPEIAGLKHVYLAAPGSDAHRSRHAMAIHPGWFDRSPCGTGTSARMAQLHARGALPLHRDFVNESFIGTEFTGRLIEETEVGGVPAVVPRITGVPGSPAPPSTSSTPTIPFPEVSFCE